MAARLSGGRFHPNGGRPFEPERCRGGFERSRGRASAHRTLRRRSAGQAAMSFIGPEGRKQLKLAARFASVGFELATAVVVGYFGGRFVDQKLGTDPWIQIIG